MTKARPRGEAARVVAAGLLILLILLIILLPTLLFGQPLSVAGLIVLGPGLIGIGVGVLVRRGGAHTLGTGLVIAGAVILAFTVGIIALLLAGWGRGY